MKETALTATMASVEGEIRGYLSHVIEGLRSDTAPPELQAAEDMPLAEAIFDLVTSREFCYLSRKRTAPYREATLDLLRRRIAAEEPFRFFYDVGPGYHASLRPGDEEISFEVGLSEMLILSQISLLSRRLTPLYPPGLRFWLVVDNICGLRTNDIPLHLTEAYCARLRTLISEVGLDERVTLLVESEQFDLDEYDRLLAELEPGPVDPAPSPEAVENVQRFLGRRCSTREAAERIERYERTAAVTERLLDDLVRGVHMTQRATGATLGFRPFPGGDSRTQSGQVVLGRNKKGRLRPFLMTSRNVDGYESHRLTYPDLLPPSVTHITYAAAPVA
jgi:hypothetical protein